MAKHVVADVFHGFVFSLFFNHWLEAKGSKEVFLVLGGIQMGVLLFTIPLYIYGKRLRCALAHLPHPRFASY